MAHPPHETNKMSVILERFRQTQSIQSGELKDPNILSNRQKRQKINQLEPIQAHGLTPLPQPDQPENDNSLNTNKSAASQFQLRSDTDNLEWPVEPVYLDGKETKPFKDLKLCQETIERLNELDFHNAFPVQIKLIDRVLTLQRTLSPDPLPNILVNSYTGSGKTLAYLIPIIEILRTQSFSKIRALIIVPSKVLISQIKQLCLKLTSGTRIRVQTLQTSRPLAKELEILKTETPDIVIAAPGRLTEHVTKEPDLFTNLKFIVADEADRLVGQSFYNWTSILEVICPKPDPLLFKDQWYRPPQKLIFSATLTKNPGKLNDLQVTNFPYLPELYITGTPSNGSTSTGGTTSTTNSTGEEFVLPHGLHETVIRVNGIKEKPLALVHKLVHANNNLTPNHTLIFTRSNEAAIRLAKLIDIIAQSVFQVDLHVKHYLRQMGTAQQNRLVKEFQEENNSVLVCTELMARGVDLTVDLVINYDMPFNARDFVHRVGRTARAGEQGHAWSFIAPGHELELYYQIHNSINHANEVIDEEFNGEYDREKYGNALKEFNELV